MMKRFVIRLLKVTAVVIMMLIMLAIGTFFLVQTDSVQQKLLSYATNLLSQELHTKVEINKISLSLTGGVFKLHGMTVEDQQQQKMLQVEELGVRVALRPLLHHKVQLKKATLTGADFLLYKPAPDSVANYQFLVDYFKNKHPKTDKPDKPDTVAHPSQKIAFDISKVKLERINVNYNNGKSDQSLYIGSAYLHNNCRQLDIDSLRYVTDNHRPRRNFGKPKHGFFDAGHLNVTAKIRLQLEHLSKDSVVAAITECEACDISSGIDVRSMNGKVTVNKQMIQIDSLNLHLPETKLNMQHVNIQLPNKEKERQLSYSIPQITGTVVLRDIAHPFAPVLKDFKVPLSLTAKVVGTKDAMYYQNVTVATTDKKLRIKASGNISHLKDKKRLHVHFNVHKMTARSGSKELIINQFPVKKFMMKQLHRLGDISYTGRFDVRWKEEEFAGLLGTTAGNIDFHFTIDEMNKYITGKAGSEAFELGQVMEMPDIGKLACTAQFKFDISKPRTARMRRLKGGKLPIGEVSAEVVEAKYKKIKMHNLEAELTSDGALAEGHVKANGRYIDLLCKFSFTNTDEMKKTKIVPGIKFHKKRKKDDLH